MSVDPRPSREDLGRRVCEVALRWSREQDDRPGATATWEELSPELRELYMRVGGALFGLGMTWSPVPSPLPDSETEWRPKPGERVVAKLASHPDDDIEGNFVRHTSGWQSMLDIGGPLGCGVLRATLRPVAVDLQGGKR